MPRYVILQHELPPGHALPRTGAGQSPATHWDVMLEWGGVLRTWAVPQPPASGETYRAELLADHRLAYLEYEGPISGNRGTVRRWDAGTYEIEHQTEAILRIQLHGERLRCEVVISAPGKPAEGKSGENPNENAQPDMNPEAALAHFWRLSFGSAPTRG